MKRKRATKILSQKGKEIVQKRRREMKHNTDSDWWLIEAYKHLSDNSNPDEAECEENKLDIGVPLTTWKRFLYAQSRIQADTFDAFCKVLNVEPQSVAEAEASDSSTLLGDPPEILNFYGRRSLLKQLKDCIIRSPKLLLVYGKTGIGKTSLVRRFVDEVNDSYEYQAWFSLESYLHVKELLNDFANEMDLDLTKHDSSWQALLQEVLLPFLREHKCLIIIDDWDVSMRSKSSSNLNHLDYQDHINFLRELSSRRHRSCFIIISRENPINLELERHHSVKVLRVGELNYEDDKEMLKAEGLSGSETELRYFLDTYSTPLILSRIARKVKNISNGNVSRFVCEGASTIVDPETFDLLREELLDLTTSEKNIVFSLALWRSFISYEKLLEEFIRLMSMNQLINDLDSLIQKSIIQQEEEAVYSLKPMFLKAVTLFFVDEVSTGITETLNLGNTQSLNILSTNILIKDMKDEVLVTEIKRRVIRPIFQKLQPLYNSKKASLLDDLRNLVSSVEQSDHSTGFTVRNLQLIIHEVEEM